MLSFHDTAGSILFALSPGQRCCTRELVLAKPASGVGAGVGVGVGAWFRKATNQQPSEDVQELVVDCATPLNELRSVEAFVVCARSRWNDQ
jgi:hypothetical protein